MTGPIPEALTASCKCCPTRILAPREVRKALAAYVGAARLPRELELAAFGFCSIDCLTDHDYVATWMSARRGIVR